MTPCSDSRTSAAPGARARFAAIASMSGLTSIPWTAPSEPTRSAIAAASSPGPDPRSTHALPRPRVERRQHPLALRHDVRA